jgi:cell division FtsZ-interacting protein ZapD
MSEIDQHIEAIRSIFKKVVILPILTEVKVWDELDKFSEELHSYFDEKKIDKKIIEDLIKKFENSSLNIDKRISVEIQRIFDEQYLES